MPGMRTYLEPPMATQADHADRSGASDCEARATASLGVASTHPGSDFSEVPVHPPSTGVIQAKSVPDGATHDTAPPIAHAVPRSPGQALEPAARMFLESRMRHDFSAVRVHANAEAAQAARAIDARAYTLGQDIVFAQGEYAPTTAEGRRLLAHELTHVVQQRRGIVLKGSIGQVGDPYERHADAVADAVVSGRTADMLLAQSPSGASLGVGAHASIQREQSATATAPIPVSAPTEPLAETEGDKMRKAILAAAQGRYGQKTTIVSEAEIKDIQEGRWRLRPVKQPDGSEIEMSVRTATPVKNFTTCIEFAGQTFADAVKARSGELHRNTKDTIRTARLLSGIIATFNKEFGIQAQIDAFNNAIKMYDKPIVEQKARIGTFDKKKVDLAATKTGENFHDKGVEQQIKGQELAIRQIGSAIDGMKREQVKLDAKIQKLKNDYAELDAKDDALIRAEAPLSRRPKPGEYLLLGAGSAQAYGVSKATNVTLAKGSFKHIAVFKSSEEAPSPKAKPEEKWEKWYTIDGGGTTARTSGLYVCITDLRVQFGNPDNPWSTSKTSLIGWIDMNSLMTDDAAKATGSSAP